MWLVTDTMRYLAGRYLAEPKRSNQHISRANAAEAHGILRQRRRDQEEVNAYLRATLAGIPGGDESTNVRASR